MKKLEKLTFFTALTVINFKSLLNCYPKHFGYIYQIYQNYISIQDLLGSKNNLYPKPDEREYIFRRQRIGIEWTPLVCSKESLKSSPWDQRRSLATDKRGSRVRSSRWKSAPARGRWAGLTTPFIGTITSWGTLDSRYKIISFPCNVTLAIKP